MKSYERSCGEIYTKANKQISGICQFKRKLKMIITPVVSVGVLLAMLLSMVACTYNREGYIDNETEKASESDFLSLTLFDTLFFLDSRVFIQALGRE